MDLSPGAVIGHNPAESHPVVISLSGELKRGPIQFLQYINVAEKLHNNTVVIINGFHVEKYGVETSCKMKYVIWQLLLGLLSWRPHPHVI